MILLIIFALGWVLWLIDKDSLEAKIKANEAAGKKTRRGHSSMRLDHGGIHPHIG